MAQAAVEWHLNDISDDVMSRKHYLKPGQRRQLEESIARNENALNGRAPNGGPLPAVPGIQAPDAAMLRENIARDRAMLEAGTPPELNELQRRKRILRIAELEDEIRRGMPSIDQMWRPLAPNVDACIAHGRYNKKRILARQSLLSEVDPENDDPNFRSVELLRTNDPPNVDLRQYYRNYDLIQWRKDAELLQAEEIGEETFQRFCVLKAAEWAAANIRRELALSEAQYAQALKRLREMKETVSPAGEGHLLSTVPPPPVAPMQPPQTVLQSLSIEFTGKELKAALTQADISQASFARRIGMSLSRLSSILLERRKVTDAERLRILRGWEEFKSMAQTERPQVSQSPEEEHVGEEAVMP